jgi:DNA-binding NarL/FixJ family response regulator
MSAGAVRPTHRSSNAPRISVLLADDHPLILAGIRRTLERSDDIEVIGEARTGPQLLAMVERRRPGVVLLDLHMPGVVGADCITTIRRKWPSIKVVVLSAADDQKSIDGALDAGASAYILKSVNPLDLPSVIHNAVGAAVFYARPRPVAAPEAVGCAGLTPREQTVLSAVAAGSTTAAISHELWLSEHTVKFHLTNIYRKLGVSNRAGAVRCAVEQIAAA